MKYLEIYRALRHEIAHGELKGKLPSKRSLAAQENVSLITVEKAYELLLAEGYITSKERKGYYACELAPIVKVDKPKVEIAAPEEIHEYDADFPFSAWAKCIRAALTQCNPDYLVQNANKHLREALAEGVCDPNQIVVAQNIAIDKEIYEATEEDLASAQRKRELLNWSRERQDRYLLEDNLQGSSLFPIDAVGKVIVRRSFPEIIGVTYYILPPELLPQKQSANPVIHEALARYIKRPGAKRPTFDS